MATNEVRVAKPNEISNCGYGSHNRDRVSLCWCLGRNACPFPAFWKGCWAGKIARALYAHQERDRKKGESEA